MRILLAAALVLVPTLAPIAARADAQPDVSKLKADDCARARKAGKTCVINIEGIDVEGHHPTGTGENITTPGFGTSKSLIRIRKDFIAEILKSAEDLP